MSFDVRAMEAYGWLLLGRERASAVERVEGSAWAQLAMKRGYDHFVDRALGVKKRPTGDEWEAGKAKLDELDASVPVFTDTW